MTEPAELINRHEAWQRAVKAHRIALLIGGALDTAVRSATGSLSDESVAQGFLLGLRRANGETRAAYAKAAGCAEPSDTTWELALDMVTRERGYGRLSGGHVPHPGRESPTIPAPAAPVAGVHVAEVFDRDPFGR